MPLPKKLASRTAEITQQFLLQVDRHISDLLLNRAGHRYHASDFAKLLFIHPRHLTNTIRLTTGKSPCSIMEERILCEAEKLLRETGLPVAAIAARFGYDEPTNFTKFFKGLSGITPLQYRKQAVGHTSVKY